MRGIRMTGEESTKNVRVIREREFDSKARRTLCSLLLLFQPGPGNDYARDKGINIVDTDSLVSDQ